MVVQRRHINPMVMWKQQHSTLYALSSVEQHLLCSRGPRGPHWAPHHVAQGPPGWRGGVCVMEAVQGGGEDDTSASLGGGMVNDEDDTACEYATIMHVL